MAGSNVIRFSDYSALVAMQVQGVILPTGDSVGVRSAYGTGTGGYTDALRVGQPIQPRPEKPIEPFSHYSGMPEGQHEPLTQDGAFARKWVLPMQLFTSRGSVSAAEQSLMSFYEPYLLAFEADLRLGGLCDLAYISSQRVTSQEETDWPSLYMELTILETAI
jgi:hypothetical protein